MSRTNIFSAEGAFALLLVALGVVVIAGSVQLGVGTLEQPGTGLFPLFSGCALSLGAAAIAARLALQPPAEREPMFEPGSARTLVIVSATFVAWIVVMPLTGFVLGTFLCVIAFAKALGLEGWVKPLALALGTAVGVYLLFDRMLYLDLPAGIWG